MPPLPSPAFIIGARRFTCDLEGTACATRCGGGGGLGRASARNEAPSPDRKRTALIRDHNLWVRDAESGADTQLTTDGVKDFGYATDNAGASHPVTHKRLPDPDVLLASAASTQHVVRGAQ